LAPAGQSDASDSRRAKLGLNAAWSMAVGGMVGGGIFSTLGVIVSIAGRWAWLSFAAAGLIALAAGYSYVKLAARHGEGGAFTFLRKVCAERFAGTLSWMLIAGYVLTNAVYAFTLGQYLGNVAGLGGWFSRTTAVTVVAIFVALNLKGIREAGGVEIVLVWFKLAVLVGLAGWGLSHWNVPNLSVGVPDSGLAAAVFGAASVFMAYEGFQLLSYSYEDISAPRKTLPRAVLSAIVVVSAVYVVIAVGVAMLIGADQIVRHKEVALAVAGQRALGTAGLVIVTVAAAFSTGSAINATLFATGRLARRVAQQGELPEALDHVNAARMPDRAVVGMGAAAAVLAAVGTLTSLVEAASFTFLFTFTVVCWLAFRGREGARSITGFGAAAGAGATVALAVRLVRTDPLALTMLGALALAAVFGRPALLRRTRSKRDPGTRACRQNPAERSADPPRPNE
jgi:amino acid transporter